MALVEEFTAKVLKGTGEASRAYQIVKKTADEAQHGAAISDLLFSPDTIKSL